LEPREGKKVVHQNEESGESSKTSNATANNQRGHGLFRGRFTPKTSWSHHDAACSKEGEREEKRLLNGKKKIKEGKEIYHPEESLMNRKKTTFSNKRWV